MGALRLPIGSYERHTGSPIRLLNCYAEQGHVESKSPIILSRIPGVAAFGTVATSGLRGAAVWNETVYAVIGSKLYSVDETGAGTTIGSIVGAGRVAMGAGTYLGIVTAAGAGYTYDGTTLALISDADFPSSAAGSAVLDDYLVVFKRNTNQFNASDKGDFTSWAALSFDNATGADDVLIGIAAGQSKLYLGGERSTEIWWNAGLSPFPFQRIPNGVIDLGLAAQYSQTIIDNTVVWFAHDGTVRALRGLTPQRISNHANEAKFATYSNPQNAFAMAMTIRGHAWYVLTFPDQATWVYDFNTGEWFECASLGSNEWLVDAYVRAYNKDLVFHAAKIGRMDEEVFDEWGTEIPAYWTYPSVYGEGRAAVHKRFEIRADVGIGNSAVNNPMMTLYISDDGGRIFTAMPTKSLGKIGKYRTPLVWTRLGRSTDRVYRCQMSDAARLVIWDTQVEADGGRLIGAR
jgi:hypothetical protein